MDEIKTNVPKTFTDRVSRKLGYFLVLTALVAMAAAGYTFLPDAEVSAQERDAKASVEAVEAPEVATQAMLDFALNLRSASEYSVYAERGVVDKGSSTVRGTTGNALRSEAGRKSTKELSNTIDAVRQLPCTELKSSDLTGRSFGPGVYCMASAELAGEMTLDSAGNAAGLYVFRVAGSLNARSGSSIRLENGAQGGNVFFVAEQATIGNDASFRANILTKGNISIGTGATVTDRVLSLGKVSMDSARLLGGTTGTMEICKEQQLPVSAANDLSNQIFFFVVTGATGIGTAANPVRVPVGSCSSPFDVTAGPQTVTELNNGALITPASGTFTGNFELTGVVNLTPASTSTLGLVNLATRVANVNITAGGVNDQITLQFTNRETLTGFIEICKRAAAINDFNTGGGDVEGTIGGGGNGGGNPDPDVSGFFSFTIEDVLTVNQQNPGVRTLQVFTVPVGQCTGPIAVTKGSPSPSGGDPRESAAFVTELGRNGFFLESIEVIPADRRNSADVLGLGINANGGTFTNVGGGFVDVIVQESVSTADETLVIFTNRSNPGRVKVCKIAGPGIPINTIFTFTVNGIGATNAASPQTAIFGPVTRTFDVRAGDPAQGGTCEFVPGFGANAPGFAQFQTFVNGTPVFVFENGISVNNTIPQNPGELRASRIRQFGSAFTSTAIAGFSPNPNLIPAAAATSSFQTQGPFAINDNSTINVPVNVPNPGLVSDVNARVRLNHTFDADVAINLIDPAGRNIVLSSNNGGAGDNYGTGANDCTGAATIFDDEAGTAVTAGSAPFSGSFRPEGLLSTFDGRGQNGIWQFRIADQATLDVGVVGCVRLDFVSSAFVARAAVFARASIVEVEFTNFRFNPTVLKVCKIGSGALLGTNFTFNVALVSPVSQPDSAPMFPAFTQAVSVTAGPAAQGGNCTFVNGGGLLGGAFNQGSTITITETAGNVTAITSSSAGSGGLTTNLVTRVGTLSGPNGLVAGINVVTFTNSPAPAPISERAVRFDFDGDRKADASVYSAPTGMWTIAESRQGNLSRSTNFGISTDKQVTADYDGDGKSDVAVFRASTGMWYFNTGSRYEAHNWGQAGDIPLAGDYNGDGRADFAVWRPSNGTMYIKHSDDTFRVFQFGIPTDKAYSADFDGDGSTDLAMFRNGTWYQLNSRTGFRVYQFGQTGDIPVPADYDGDGAADVAVYRAGMWYMLSATTYTSRQLGTAADVPVPADYDGDGKADVSIFRPSEGKWYIQRSNTTESSAADTITLGSATDTPVPAQY